MLLIRLAILVKSWTQKLKKVTWEIIPSLPPLFSFNFPNFFHLMPFYMLDQKALEERNRENYFLPSVQPSLGQSATSYRKKVSLRFLVQPCKQRIKLTCAFIWTTKYFETLAIDTNSVWKEHKASIILSWLQILIWQCLRTKIQPKGKEECFAECMGSNSHGKK